MSTKFASAPLDADDGCDTTSLVGISPGAATADVGIFPGAVASLVGIFPARAVTDSNPVRATANTTGFMFRVSF
ncbi:MAG TPA: hypothetical protein VN844_01600 [Pyrinomonadaceae bacterium]|nr:hypothetical protein [Pyrinomonadaceae bacterium]